MKLRWVVYCDKNGVKTEPELEQCTYDDSYLCKDNCDECDLWVSIDTAEIKTD